MSESHSGIPQASGLEPLEPAILLKSLSDTVWGQSPNQAIDTDWAVPCVIEPEVAITELNELVGQVDESVVFINAGKKLIMGGPYTEDHLEIPAVALVEPDSITVGTSNMDHLAGHREYLREMWLKCGFRSMLFSGLVVLEYAIQRYEPAQGKPTKLSFNAWYSEFAETGYEGSQYPPVRMTPEQELQILELFQKIGGIVLPNQTSAN